MSGYNKKYTSKLPLGKTSGGALTDMGVHCRKSKGNRGGNSSTIWNAHKQQRSVENGNESMGDVINFPNRKVDEPSEADVFHTLVYRLWMR